MLKNIKSKLTAILIITLIIAGVFFSIKVSISGWRNNNSDFVQKQDSEIKPPSLKKDFKSYEEPELKFHRGKADQGIIADVLKVFDKQGKIKATARIINPKGKAREAAPDEIIENNGDISVKLKNSKEFKPGLYKVVLKVEDRDKIQTFEQDFTWGVLAINVNKSICLSGEEVYLQLGVLKDDGHTICDASLELRIKNYELGIETLLSTENGTIEYSGQCSGNNVTDVPDYFAHYTTGEAGIYEMTLTNLNNDYKITDSFEVREFIPFEVERIGPSRIYPPADYEMILKIKANEDFIGFIQEKVPASFIVMDQELRIKNQETEEFEIYDSQFIKQEESDNIKLLRWHDLNLKQNDELEIKYQFDAPDVSPDLHLLGPLGFYE
ncbi:hypothetical protein KAJ61_01310 [Candidatus Parcubacteria bacterium]|nr:hypothetical protein [Candidatus Parcubacteria bacterium]